LGSIFSLVTGSGKTKSQPSITGSHTSMIGHLSINTKCQTKSSEPSITAHINEVGGTSSLVAGSGKTHLDLALKAARPLLNGHQSIKGSQASMIGLTGKYR